MDEVTAGFDWFRDDGIFAPMLNDRARNQFYKQAIERSVPGKVVVDIGAGTGLLSVLSAKAGARHVYAVERDAGRSAYVQQVVDHLNMRDKITVVAKDFLDTNIVADVYVSETINTQIFGEDMHILANHARQHGGCFIPSYIDIWAEIYAYHPIFILDQSASDASTIDTKISIDLEFANKLNQDFKKRHPKTSTLYTANQLNKLFTLLPRFTDIKLRRLYKGDVLRLDLNAGLRVEDLRLCVPHDKLPQQNQDLHLVLFWRAGFQDICMSSSDTWFGNVTKCIEMIDRMPGVDIETWYDQELRNWRLIY